MEACVWQNKIKVDGIFKTFVYFFKTGEKTNNVNPSLNGESSKFT